MTWLPGFCPAAPDPLAPRESLCFFHRQHNRHWIFFGIISEDGGVVFVCEGMRENVSAYNCLLHRLFAE